MTEPHILYSVLGPSLLGGYWVSWACAIKTNKADEETRKDEGGWGGGGEDLGEVAEGIVVFLVWKRGGWEDTSSLSTTTGKEIAARKISDSFLRW